MSMNTQVQIQCFKSFIIKMFFLKSLSSYHSQILKVCLKNNTAFFPHPSLYKWRVLWNSFQAFSASGNFANAPSFPPLSGARLNGALEGALCKSPHSSFGYLLRDCRFSDSSPQHSEYEFFLFLIDYLLHLVLIQKRPEYEFLNKWYSIPDLGRSKHQPLNKWEGGRQLFPFGLTHVPVQSSRSFVLFGIGLE